jgi:aminopeptidase N
VKAILPATMSLALRRASPLLLLLAACTTDRSARTSPSRADEAPAPFRFADPAGSAEVHEVPESSPNGAAPAPNVAQPPPSPDSPLHGSAGIGDSLIPMSGNGGYDVQNYVIAIAYDPSRAEDEQGTIRATATIDAKSTQELDRFHLDFHGLDIESILVDGEAAAFERDGDELIVSPKERIAKGATFRTVVRYSGVPDGVEDHTLPIPVDIGWTEKNGEVYVFSQPTGAMSFFPCNDHPLDKALVRLEVDVPRPLEVVGNGHLAEVVESDARRTFVWESRDPMATYLVTIAIADFDEQRIEGPNGLEIVNYFSPRAKERQRADFDFTDEIIAFLSDTFGEYPFESCGNILSSLPIPGALETQTKPVYGISANDESIICHELAHQWFGDAVSVADWNDIWINEGFAEYAAWMYLESRKGPEALEKHVLGHYSLARFAKAEPPGKVEAKTMFGVGVYVRGPLALHSLRTSVGDEAFLGLMRSWYQGHRNSNASLEQFVEHVRTSLSADAVALLEPWLFDEEMPKVAAWDEKIEADKKERAEKKRLRDEERARRKSEREKDAKEPQEPPKDG